MDDTEIGRRLRALRESRGMTQRDLAAKTGLSQAAINRYENGRHIKLDVWRALAAALGVHVDLVVTAGPPEPLTAAQQEALAAAHEVIPHISDELALFLRDTIRRLRQAEHGSGAPNEG